MLSNIGNLISNTKNDNNMGNMPLVNFTVPINNYNYSLPNGLAWSFWNYNSSANTTLIKNITFNRNQSNKWQ
jgi:hypothetical protein